MTLEYMLYIDPHTTGSNYKLMSSIGFHHPFSLLLHTKTSLQLCFAQNVSNS